MYVPFINHIFNDGRGLIVVIDSLEKIKDIWTLDLQSKTVDPAQNHMKNRRNVDSVIPRK